MVAIILQFGLYHTKFKGHNTFIYKLFIKLLITNLNLDQNLLDKLKVHFLMADREYLNKIKYDFQN